MAAVYVGRFGMRRPERSTISPTAIAWIAVGAAPLPLSRGPRFATLSFASRKVSRESFPGLDVCDPSVLRAAPH
jgi:hypothetical protein